MRDIALSYVYWMPQSMFLALPAAVLFATVFSIGTFTRHSEVTAAKASGISFYRLIAPILLGAMLAAGLDLVIGEMVPDHRRAPQRAARREQDQRGTQRYNFAYAGEYGRVYKAHRARRRRRARWTGCRSNERGTGRIIRRLLISAPATDTTRQPAIGKAVDAAAGRDARHPRHDARLQHQLRGRCATSTWTTCARWT